MNTKYFHLLSHHIQQSGLTLRQIAKRCRDLHHSIDPSYISKLQTGQLPPPSEEVSQTLAKVLNADAEELIYLGYIEKAPLVIKQKLVKQNLPNEVLSCAMRISRLSPMLRIKVMNELEWLEKLEKKLSTLS